MGLYLKKNSKMLIKLMAGCSKTQHYFLHFSINGDILPEKNPCGYTERSTFQRYFDTVCLIVRSVTLPVSHLQKNVKESGEIIRDFHSMGTERIDQQRNRRELMGANSEVLSGQDVFLTIIRKEQGFGRLSGSRDCGVVDLPIRFQRADDMGKDLRVKMSQYVVVPRNVVHVGFIRVGDQNQGVAFMEIGEQGLRNE